MTQERLRWARDTSIPTVDAVTGSAQPSYTATLSEDLGGLGVHVQKVFMEHGEEPEPFIALRLPGTGAEWLVPVINGQVSLGRDEMTVGLREAASGIAWRVAVDGQEWEGLATG